MPDRLLALHVRVCLQRVNSDAVGMAQFNQQQPTCIYVHTHIYTHTCTHTHTHTEPTQVCACNPPPPPPHLSYHGLIRTLLHNIMYLKP